jgi:hypothetical protein
LWRHCSKKPNDPSVGEGPGRLERLPPTRPTSYKGNVRSGRIKERTWYGVSNKKEKTKKDKKKRQKGIMEKKFIRTAGIFSGLAEDAPGSGKFEAGEGVPGSTKAGAHFWKEERREIGELVKLCQNAQLLCIGGRLRKMSLE